MTTKRSGDEKANETAKVFGRKMRERRIALGMSQYALADKAGISRETIRKLEGGKSEPSFGTAQVVALALDMPLQELTNPALEVQPGEPKKPGRPRKGVGAEPEPEPENPPAKKKRGRTKGG